jgi:DNA-binding transcriptional regulator YiaG
MPEQMSNAVRTLRRQLSMTQEEFAHELGITVGTVNRWENGRFRPSKLARATLLEFALRHGLSLDQSNTSAPTGHSGAMPTS